MRCYTIPVVTVPLEKLSRTVSAGPAYQQRIRDRLADHVRPGLELPNSVAGAGLGSTRRDQDFFSYKSFTNNFVIEVAGVAMWIKTRRRAAHRRYGAAAGSGDSRRCAELKRLARSHGITKITFQASPGTEIERSSRPPLRRLRLMGARRQEL